MGQGWEEKRDAYQLPVFLLLFFLPHFSQRRNRGNNCGFAAPAPRGACVQIPTAEEKKKKTLKEALLRSIVRFRRGRIMVVADAALPHKSIGLEIKLQGEINGDEVIKKNHESVSNCKNGEHRLAGCEAQ